MRREPLSRLGLCFICIILLSNAGWEGVCLSSEPDDQQPRLEFLLQSDRDHLELDIASEAATVTVHSPRGIGRMRVNREEGSWPEQITFHLNLADLEGLTLTTADLQLHTFLGSDETEVRVLNTETGHWEEQEEKAYTISVRRFEELEVIVAEIPPALLDAELRSFQLHWVDYYRN